MNCANGSEIAELTGRPSAGYGKIIGAVAFLTREGKEKNTNGISLTGILAVTLAFRRDRRDRPLGEPPGPPP